MRITVNSVAVLAIGFVCGPFPALSAAQSRDTNAGVNQKVSSQELDRLRQTILDETRSNFEAIFQHHNETGDRNNLLYYHRFGARVNLKLGNNSLFYVSALRTPYSTMDQILEQTGTNATLGFKVNLLEGVTSQIEVGGTRFSTGGNTINALGSLRLDWADTTMTITASRSNVEESLLSATGIRPLTGPFAGSVVGQVMDNRVVVDGVHRLSQKLDVFANGGLGTREGRNVPSNMFRVAGGGAGYNVISAPPEESISLLRASYEANYVGFDDDRFGFGGVSMLDSRGRNVPVTSIGSDGISPEAGPGRAGIGGYFSPENYFSHVIRGELRGQPIPELQYQVTLFVGSQYYTGSDRRQAAGASGTITLRLSDRYSLPVSASRDNYGPFIQQSLLARLVVRF